MGPRSQRRWRTPAARWFTACSHAGSHAGSRGVGSPEAAHAVAWHPLRGLLRRRESWLEGLQGADRVRWRLKEGEGASLGGHARRRRSHRMWARTPPSTALRPPDAAQRARRRAAAASTSRAVRGRDGHRLATQWMTRIELGDAFVLHEPDFPLHLASRGCARVRGAEARSAADEPHGRAVALRLLLHGRDRLGEPARLWVGVPVGWVLLSCCVCCGLCCCCSESPEKKLDFDAAGMQLSADELEQDEATPWRRGRMPQPSSHRRPPLDDDDDSDH